jgi:Caulimovirus viroplasmin
MAAAAAQGGQGSMAAAATQGFQGFNTTTEYEEANPLLSASLRPTSGRGKASKAPNSNCAWYAVARGAKGPKINDNWTDTGIETVGFPNAWQKGFNDLAKAEAWLRKEAPGWEPCP